MIPFARNSVQKPLRHLTKARVARVATFQTSATFSLRTCCIATSRQFIPAVQQYRFASTAVAETGVATSTDVGKGPFSVFEAVALQMNEKQPKFQQTIDLCIMTGLDPRKPDQSIRTTVSLPHNLGKVVRVAVFAKGPAAESAREAGADIVGDSDLIDKIKGGFLEFDHCIATPAMMPELAKIGKILGPRGLMPNPKTKTVTPDVAVAIEAAKAGAITIRTDRVGTVRTGVARVGFSEQQILDNVKAVMLAMQANKPSGSKGKYITKVYLSSTMGRSYMLDPKSVDAGSAQFFRRVRGAE